MVAISQAHLTLSDTYRKDADSEFQFEHGRVDCALDAGYVALLSVLEPAEREVTDHPSEAVAVLGAERLDIDPRVGIALLRLRYSATERPTLAEALDWADGVRTQVRKHT